jgi:hypothetical protein
VLLLTRLGVRVPESPEAKGVPGRFVRYEENAYRLPIGVTVFWVVAGFVVLVLAVW